LSVDSLTFKLCSIAVGSFPVLKIASMSRNIRAISFGLGRSGRFVDILGLVTRFVPLKSSKPVEQVFNRRLLLCDALQSG